MRYIGSLQLVLHMKNYGAFAQARLLLAMTLAMSIITTINFIPTNAEANAGRLRAIERVVGLHERKHNRRIRKMVGVNPARTPWCGGAVAYAVRKAGGKPVAGHLKASNWTKFGRRVSLSSARKGDVVVLRFKRGYHVGIYKKRAGKGRVEICGGNMSNRFKCSAYKASRVKAVRR